MVTSPIPLSHVPCFTAPTQHAGHLFRVDIQVMGLALCHRWTGWASNTQEASLRGRDDARQIFNGYPLCVRNVVQVGV